MPSLIAIEGIDQSGKKTQTELLVEKLKENGVSATKMSFPDYKTPVGKLIKKILSNEIQVPLEVKHMLLSANRWELKPKIEELSEQRYTIVFDRYYQSNWAYGLANNLPIQWLKSLDSHLPRTNLTIVLDLQPNVSFRRKEHDRDIHEKDLEYLERVRRCFIKLASENKWVIVDGNLSIESVHNLIWKAVSERLKRHI
ncbi:MAG: dTMP kinase [Nitrososphaeria archaeon]